MDFTTTMTTHQRLQRTIARGCRAALAATLAVSLGVPAFGTAGQAFAADGSVTIEANQETKASYKVYKLFTADMAANAEAATSEDYPRVATHIQWADDTVKAAVLAFLADEGYGQALDPAARELPQNAAEFIAQGIGTSLDDAGAAVPRTKQAQSFAFKLAKALVDAQVTSVAYQPYAGGAQQPQAVTDDAGYYLFVTDDASVADGGAGTAPIWVPLGGSTQTIREKASVPTVSKQVREDSTGDFGKAADANRGQDLDYKLEGQLPSNYGAFSTYYLKFQDTFSAGLDLTYASSGELRDSVKVLAAPAGGGSLDITSAAGVSLSFDEQNRRLLVEIADLKAISPAIDKDTRIIVEYKAHLNGDAVIGAPGNDNDVVLSYSSNPITGARSTTDTQDDKVKTYTYQLTLNKQDKQTAVPLSGARFTVQVGQGEGSDAQSIGKYVQADGTLGEAAYEFATDAEGVLTVPRIDAGSYVIRETRAPEGYETQDADIKLTITSQFDTATGALNSVKAQVQGGEASGVLGADVVTHVEENGDESTTGIITLVTSDDKQVKMPITGMDGVQAALVYGTGAFGLGLAGWFATRRKRHPHDE